MIKRAIILEMGSLIKRFWRTFNWSTYLHTIELECFRKMFSRLDRVYYIYQISVYWYYWLIIIFRGRFNLQTRLIVRNLNEMIERINFRFNVIKLVDKDSITSIKGLLNQFKCCQDRCKQHFPRNKYNLP